MPRGKKRVAAGTEEISTSNEGLSTSGQNASASHDQQRRNLLQQFDHEVDQRCRKFIRDSESITLSMHGALSVELVRIPKAIRATKMRDYLAQCNSGAKPAVSNVLSMLAASSSVPLSGLPSGLSTQKDSAKMSATDELDSTESPTNPNEQSGFGADERTPSTRATKGKKLTPNASGATVSSSNSRKAAKQKGGDKEETLNVSQSMPVLSGVKSDTALLIPALLGALQGAAGATQPTSSLANSSSSMQLLLGSGKSDLSAIASDDAIQSIVSSDRAAAMAQLELMKANITKLQQWLKTEPV